MEQQTGFKEIFLRLVAIVGLIAVLILGAWGIILLAFNLVGLFTGSVHWSDIFSGTKSEEVATTTPSTVTTVTTNTDTNPNTQGGYTTPATTVVTKPASSATSKPAAVYTPAAKPAATLFGLPDLKVTITSVTSLSSVQGRTSVQFTVSNIGTNVARSGWTFNADLPLTPSYTYQSQGQQALYPGDKIAFTLTYDDPNFQYAYPVYNTEYPADYYNQYPYGYQNNNGVCYTYNGYQNVAGPCATYDANGNAIYGNNQYGYNQNYYQYNRVVTITLDPQNWVPESAEYNNTASKNVY